MQRSGGRAQPCRRWGRCVPGCPGGVRQCPPAVQNRHSPTASPRPRGLSQKSVAVAPSSAHSPLAAHSSPPAAIRPCGRPRGQRLHAPPKHRADIWGGDGDVGRQCGTAGDVPGGAHGWGVEGGSGSRGDAGTPGGAARWGCAGGTRGQRQRRGGGTRGCPLEGTLGITAGTAVGTRGAPGGGAAGGTRGDIPKDEGTQGRDSGDGSGDVGTPTGGIREGGWGHQRGRGDAGGGRRDGDTWGRVGTAVGTRGAPGGGTAEGTAMGPGDTRGWDAGGALGTSPGMGVEGEWGRRSDTMGGARGEQRGRSPSAPAGTASLCPSVRPAG